MAGPRITAERLALYNRYLDEIEKALKVGHPPSGDTRTEKTQPAAPAVAARALGIPQGSRHAILEAALRHTGRKMPAAASSLKRHASARGRDAAEITGASLGDRIMELLRRNRGTYHGAASMAEQFEAPASEILRAIAGLRKGGANITEHPRRHAFAIEKDLRPAFTVGGGLEVKSDKTNRFLFGVTSDNHLGSRFERMDALNNLYDRFAAAGVKAVLNAGNWIEGEARFNKHEIHTHGMDAQLRYLVEHYPQREGITTYAISGDDHEGWYAQREGIDIGVRAEQDMRAAGRKDWVNLGYMEAHVRLQNANNKAASAVLALVHPGGGSAYALSYSVQKIVESLDGGEKPAVGIYGHYHKLHGAMNIRGVWVVQSGCTQDQTTFMRKKRLEAHVGGIIMELEQDPATGAIIACKTECIRYFVRGYYENRFAAPGRPVRKAARSVS